MNKETKKLYDSIAAEYGTNPMKKRSRRKLISKGYEISEGNMWKIEKMEAHGYDPIELLKMAKIGKVPIDRMYNNFLRISKEKGEVVADKNRRPTIQPSYNKALIYYVKWCDENGFEPVQPSILDSRVKRESVHLRNDHLLIAVVNFRLMRITVR